MFKNLCNFFKKAVGQFASKGELIGKTSKFKVYKTVDELGKSTLTTVDRATGQVVKTVEKMAIKDGLTWRGPKSFQGPQTITTVTQNNKVIQRTAVTDLSQNAHTNIDKSVETVFNPGATINQTKQLCELSGKTLSVNKSLAKNFNYNSLYNLENGKATPLIKNIRSQVNVGTFCRI